MDIRPCSADPDLWFGYADDDASDRAAKARVYEQSAIRAGLFVCAAAHSPNNGSAPARRLRPVRYGVWAG